MSACDGFGNSVGCLRIGAAAFARLINDDSEPLWESNFIEHVLPVAAKDLDVPVDDLLGYLMGRESNYRQQYRELETAAVLLPRPGYSDLIMNQLTKHEGNATRAIAIAKFLPVSIAPDEISHMHQTDLARRLGKTGLRRLPKMKRLATLRKVQFECGEGVFNRGNATVYSLVSDFLMMRNQTGPFQDLLESTYEPFLTELWSEVVLRREVRLFLIDDVSRPLPKEVRQFIQGYDAIGALDNQFTMRIHAGKLVRSSCERTFAPSLRNDHIDETVKMLESLKQYVVHTTIPGIVEYLKTFSREAA